MPSEAKSTTSPGVNSIVVSSYCVSGMRPRGIPSRRMESRWLCRGRAQVRGQMRAQHTDGERAIERSGSAFAGNVTEREAETAFAVGQEIVEVASQFARGNVGRGEVEPGNLARAVGKQASLDFASHVQILLKTELRVACFLIEARVFQRDGDIGAERLKHAFMFGRECMGLDAFEVEDADEAIAQQKRHD